MSDITERLPDGRLVVKLEAVEAFLDRCDTLEQAVEQIKEILNSKQVNDALLDIFDGKKSSEDITKAFLAIKQTLAKL